MARAPKAFLGAEFPPRLGRKVDGTVKATSLSASDIFRAAVSEFYANHDSHQKQLQAVIRFRVQEREVHPAEDPVL